MRDDVETGAAEWGPKAPGVETPRATDKPKDAVLGDARCLDIKTCYGKRSREWLEVSDDCAEIPMSNWPIDWPRSTLWVARYMADAG